jgi:acetylornithine deacetylase/succinyl-diaminopimelate desuccinylase-like protein
MKAIAPVLGQIDQSLPDSLRRLFDLIRFPSVATDPAYHGDCQRAAAWMCQTLQGLGMAASIEPTTGQPVVVGHLSPPDLAAHAPHILFYGHYDVQPADPAGEWLTPAFEPEIRKGKGGQDQIFARGACDDKGQLMTFLEACRAWLQVHGSLPFRLTVLIEGDEEGDSSHLDRFLAARAGEFSADVAVICDTEMWDERTPAIITSLRGCIAEEVVVSGPRIDLHSGYYGGAAINPIKVLSRILAGLHDRNGRITIPGFYAGITPLSPARRRSWAKLGATAKAILDPVGLRLAAGESGYSAVEQMWARPTAEINGISGGYTGVGGKTVLPAKAMAKLTFRLVHGQNPAKIRKAFHAFVRQRLPADCKVAFDGSGGNNSGVMVSDDSPYVQAARRALEAEWQVAPVLVGNGGSIPVVESFSRRLGIDSLLVGFGRHDDAVHSPNEKYDVECYHRGARSWARFIGEISKQISRT